MANAKKSNNKNKNVKTKKVISKNEKVKKDDKILDKKIKEKDKKEEIIVHNKTKNIFDTIFTYDKYIFEILIAFIFFLVIFRINLSFAVAILTLIVNFYLVIKHRKNLCLFFILISLLYFNYSFIISKYISSTDNLVTIYKQIRFANTMSAGIYSVFIFVCIIGIFLSGKDTTSTIDTTHLQKKYSKKYNLIMGSIIIALISVLILLSYLLGADYLRALYEYTLILFIFGYLICRENKIQTIILFILMCISMVLNLYVGGRIISLLPCIGFFFIYLANYFNYKKITGLIFLGIIFFTFFGLYGDIKDADKDFSRLTPSYLVDTINQRKFALDTSISSYWTGLTFIELTNYESSSIRLKNFSEYMFIYTPLGNKFSNYNHVYEKALDRYTHYHGGYLTSYFYYWLGYMGVILISCYVGYLLRLMKFNDKNNKYYDLKMIISIYVLSTIPRWYLYYPASLFRGMITLIIGYFIIDKISKWGIFNEENK